MLSNTIRMNTLELIPSAIYTGEAGDTCYICNLQFLGNAWI